jgi:prepilin-type N-terminal cleavage/methylation domain-containing protein
MPRHMTMRSRPGGARSPHADAEPLTAAAPYGSSVEVDPHQAGLAPRDRGLSLIEVLIAIVLMGTVVVAVVGLLQVTISASGTDRDHSNAHAWLQSAADVLYARELQSCAPDGALATNKADIAAAYEATLKQTENPEDWPDANIRIYDLQFWHVNMDPVTKLTEEGWGLLCDTADTDLQRIGIEVRSTTGEIVEQVEVIIGE